MNLSDQFPAVKALDALTVAREGFVNLASLIASDRCRIDGRPVDVPAAGFSILKTIDAAIAELKGGVS